MVVPPAHRICWKQSISENYQVFFFDSNHHNLFFLSHFRENYQVFEGILLTRKLWTLPKMSVTVQTLKLSSGYQTSTSRRALWKQLGNKLEETWTRLRWTKVVRIAGVLHIFQVESSRHSLALYVSCENERS